MNNFIKKYINKKTFSVSNIVFVIAVVVLLYPPSREWFMRQIAFSPSINKVEEAEKINTYNWELKGVNTSNINFKEFEGKVIFVNFWATWCPPCRAELPMIQNLYDEYKDKIEFVFVTDESLGTVEKFFNKNNYNLPTYNSKSMPPQKFTETNSIPATYLLDKKGNIIIDKTGSADWDSTKVKELLDKLINE